MLKMLLIKAYKYYYKYFSVFQIFWRYVSKIYVSYVFLYNTCSVITFAASRAVAYAK
jgi:hypothetical protein